MNQHKYVLIQIKIKCIHNISEVQNVYYSEDIYEIKK